MHQAPQFVVEYEFPVCPVFVFALLEAVEVEAVVVVAVTAVVEAVTDVVEDIDPRVGT